MPIKKITKARPRSVEQEERRPLPTVQPETDKVNIIGIFIADLHLDGQAPPMRSEEDWFGVMRRYLYQVASAAQTFNAPVIIAGDLFDRPKQTPELTNFAIEMFQAMGEVYAIPGQHDLPYHKYNELYKSTYGTMLASGAVKNLPLNEPIIPNNKKMVLYGFPWGTKPNGIKHKYSEALPTIAVIHGYIWSRDWKSFDAPEDSHVYAWSQLLSGFDYAFFGDNHIPFAIAKLARQNDPVTTTIFNCGTFMRRHRNEIDIRPGAIFLYDNNTWIRWFLDTEGDNLVTNIKDVPRQETFDISAVVEKLRETTDNKHDFEKLVRHIAKECSEMVEKMLLDCLEYKNG